VILVDSNILMCAAGVAHPHKQLSLEFLERVAEGEIEGVLDAEVLQEILHRYSAIGRSSDGRLVYDLARQIFPPVIPITSDVLDRARALLDDYEGLMARHALHAAVVEIHSLEAICSYDCDFDRVRTIRRLEPGC
jgi:uncharacterized protein